MLDIRLDFRQYDQDFFKEMHEETGVDLENIVYYKDEVNGLDLRQAFNFPL